MNRQSRKLMNDVARVLKVLEEEEGMQSVTVKYNLNWRDDNTHCRAYIMGVTDNYSTGNGHERTYSCQLMEKLIDLYKKHNVHFHVGVIDNVEMHIQIYVPT